MDLLSNPDSPKDDISTNSLYDTALENLTFSLDESSNKNSTTSPTFHTEALDNTATDFDDLTLNGDNLSSASNSTNLSIDNSSSDNIEVDPKSQLANKTIFKTDNPNLSIIEICDTSANLDENSVYLIESDEDLNEQQAQYQIPTEHVKKVNAKLHSSKQKLNISAETSPTASNSSRKGNLSPNNISNINKKESNMNLEKRLHIEGDKTNNDIKKDEIKGQEKKLIKIYETIEEFDNNLPDTVTVLTTSYGSKVYLIGTAHFSEESQDDVSFVIRNVRPDIVMVELCPSRIHILKYDEKTLLEEAKNFNMAKIRNIINTNGFINGIFFILLLHMSAQLAKELGMAPGGEFRRAFDEVNQIPGCMLHLGDRPINITLQRALRALSFWQTLKLVWRLTSTESISIEEVEECKQRDLLEKLMKEMAGEFPLFSDVFVKERDLYLCHSLQVAALPFAQLSNGLPKPVRVVGVVGIGHAAGIVQNWGKVDPNKIPEILTVPPASKCVIALKYVTKYGTLGLLAYGILKLIRPRIMKFF